MTVWVVWKHLSEEVAFELKNYKNQPCKDLGGEYLRPREEQLQRSWGSGNEFPGAQ